MANIFRRGLTWCVRLHIPRDRQEDAAKATGAKTSRLREQWRSLETRDHREAVARRDAALAEMRAGLDARLRAKGLRPLTDWRSSWADEARRLRDNLEANRNAAPYGFEEDPQTGARVPWTTGDLALDEIREAAETLAETAGAPTANRFYALATGGTRTLAELRDAWLAEVEANGRRKHQTVVGHRATLRLLEVFLRNYAALPSLGAATLADVTRGRAADFIAWRLATVSAKTGKRVSGATVKRELSSLSGLWRWSARRDDAVSNPWQDQTADLPKTRRGATDEDDDAAKRPYTAPELVALLRADADAWAPNGGGYGAALWDAVRLALLTGCRANELAGLRCGDVLNGGAAIRVRGGKTANARRTIPLPEHAGQVIRARLASLPATGPADPLWPEIPPQGVDGHRGKLLSTRFGKARERILPGARGVDFHSFRRSFAAALRDAMHANPKAGNKALLAVLMGHSDGSLALGVYAPGALETHKRRFIDAMVKTGLDPSVRDTLDATAGNRPPVVRSRPVQRPVAPTPGQRKAQAAPPGRPARGAASRRLPE